MKKAFTLIELLVVLAIMAAIATSVALSTSGMMDRARRDRAMLQGEAMRRALICTDGLNAAADMGMNPCDFKCGSLALLASRTFRVNTAYREDGAIDDSSPGDLRHAPLFRGYDLVALKNSSTNSPSALAALNDILREHQDISNHWAAAKICAGWRGPYCTELRPDETTRLLPDPFGGWWDARNLADASGTFAIISLGQDLLPESDASADANDFRNADIVLPVSPTNGTISVFAELQLPGDSAAGTAQLYCLSAQLDPGATDKDLVCLMRGKLLSCETAVSGSTCYCTIADGLNPGPCAFFAFLENASTHLASPIAITNLSGGTNKVRLKLDAISD